MRWKIQRFLPACLLTLCVFWSMGRECNAQAGPDSEKIASFLEEAQAKFDNQEFSAGFELYQRVLVLDPYNQTAREKIAGIAEMYKSLEDIARKEGEDEKAELLRQQQKDMTRYLLKTLTRQLESSIKSYRGYKTAENDGQDVKEEILPVLEGITSVLTDLKELYEELSGDQERTKQVVERIGKTLDDYEKELKFYSERE